MAELRTPQGHTLLLPEGCVSIGSDPSNVVPIAAHLGLAPLHFRLQPWEGGHFLEDAGSGLGTLVNGHPVHWKPLTHGDIILAGELEVVYSWQSAPASHTAPVLPTPEPAPAALGSFPPPPALPSLGAPEKVHPFNQPDPVPVPRQAGPAMPPPPAEVILPAWLPADLLPDGYNGPGASSHPNPDQVPPGMMPPEPAASPRPGAPGPASKSKRSGKRLLSLAALLAILGWGGHAAWQKGRLEPLLKILPWSNSAARQTPAHPEIPRLPLPAPASAATGPEESPAIATKIKR